LEVTIPTNELSPVYHAPTMAEWAVGGGRECGGSRRGAHLECVGARSGSRSTFTIDRPDPQRGKAVPTDLIGFRSTCMTRALVEGASSCWTPPIWISQARPAANALSSSRAPTGLFPNNQGPVKGRFTRCPTLGRKDGSAPSLVQCGGSTSARAAWSFSTKTQTPENSASIRSATFSSGVGCPDPGPSCQTASLFPAARA